MVKGIMVRFDLESVESGEMVRLVDETCESVVMVARMDSGSTLVGMTGRPQLCAQGLAQGFISLCERTGVEVHEGLVMFAQHVVEMVGLGNDALFVTGDVDHAGEMMGEVKDGEFEEVVRPTPRLSGKGLEA